MFRDFLSCLSPVGYWGYRRMTQDTEVKIGSEDSDSEVEIGSVEYLLQLFISAAQHERHCVCCGACWSQYITHLLHCASVAAWLVM